MSMGKTSLLSRSSSVLLGAIFLLSGAVALIYEAAWQRQFTLLFGSAAPATAAVLAAYFAGLGLGSYLLGKWGARWRQPLRVYGVLELIIAAGALLVAPVLSLYTAFYPDLFSRFAGGGAVFLAVKGLLAFLAIVIPTMAMGGTLPVLAQLFNNRREKLGEMAGWLYMLNTAGAAFGVLCFPALLVALGMKTSVYLCVTLNVAMAGGAFVMAKLVPVQSTVVPDETTATPQAKKNRHRKSRPADETNALPGSLRKWLALAFVSGFVTFVLQIGWSRIFAQTHENSVWSFSIIVAIFIAGIAAGAQLARVLLRRKWSPEKALSRAWLAGGILTLLFAAMFLPLSGGLKYAEGGSAFSGSLIWMAMVVIFVPVVFLAAGLPLILQKSAALSQRATGELTGMVFAGNVAGSVTGALAAGFLLPGLIGMWGTVFFAGTLAILCAAFLIPEKRLLSLIMSGIGIVAVVTAALDVWPRTRIEKGEKLLALKEGAYGVVAVTERPGSRRLKLNNHYGLGGSASVGDERMQAHIPLMLHPDPLRSVFLGYGTGITAGGRYRGSPSPTLQVGPQMLPAQVTALELVPEAAALAKEFFAEENHHFHLQPGGRLVIEDARNFLRGTPQQFNVIVGDLVVPWRQGEGALYTLEHFTAARARLASDGLYCAWLPLFQLGEEDFRCILRTFLAVFPRTSVWRGDFSPVEPAVALIGFVDGDLDPKTVTRWFRGSGIRDAANPQLKHPAGFWMHFIGMVDQSDTGYYAQLNTEDRPIVELRAKRPPPFVGRAFQAWANQVHADSVAAMIPTLPADAMSGWKAGQLMSEFTLLLSERREVEATAVQRKIGEILGAEVARSLFDG